MYLLAPASCIFSIAKYCAMLRNFSLFLPLPATLGILLPAPSSPASRTLPAPFSPGLPFPCTPPHHCLKQSPFGTLLAAYMKSPQLWGGLSVWQARMRSSDNCVTPTHDKIYTRLCLKKGFNFFFHRSAEVEIVSPSNYNEFYDDDEKQLIESIENDFVTLSSPALPGTVLSDSWWYNNTVVVRATEVGGKKDKMKIMKLRHEKL